MTLLDPQRAQVFADDDVARAYAKRPAYPPELFRFLFDLVPGRERALDLGCGPGKIALTLAGLFRRVEAVDPSFSMIEEGKRAGAYTNIDWIVASAEDAPLSGPYDLVTAGSSIHWMQHEIVFPKLAKALGQNGLVAIISGDEVSAAPWLEEWTQFKLGWLPKVGQRPDVAGIANALRSYEPWLDIAGTRDFSHVFQQSIADFIECQLRDGRGLGFGIRCRFAGNAQASRQRWPHPLRAILDAGVGQAAAIEVVLTSALVWARRRGVER